MKQLYYDTYLSNVLQCTRQSTCDRNMSRGARLAQAIAGQRTQDDGEKPLRPKIVLNLFLAQLAPYLLPEYYFLSSKYTFNRTGKMLALHCAPAAKRKLGTKLHRKAAYRTATWRKMLLTHPPLEQAISADYTSAMHWHLIPIELGEIGISLGGHIDRITALGGKVGSILGEGNFIGSTEAPRPWEPVTITAAETLSCLEEAGWNGSENGPAERIWTQLE